MFTKILITLMLACSTFGAAVSISDTLTSAVGGGAWTGQITVTLNNPGSAQPLYNSSVSLAGFSQTLCIGTTGAQCTSVRAAGVVAITLYANDSITPAGTSYSARYQPTRGGAYTETWVVGAATTTLLAIRATTVPSPTVTFSLGQLGAGGAANGQCLVYSTSILAWTPGACAAGSGSGTVTSVSVVTANGVSGSVATATTTPAITLTLGAITPTSVAASGAMSGSNLSGTNTGDQTTISGNAGTATALAANGANCSAGSFPLGVDASGASETCTALPTTIAGTANQITASAATGAITLSIPTNPTLPGTTTGTFSGNLTGNVTGNTSGTSGSTTGNAATATALAANGANCSAGSFPLGVDASGATETCTALPTTISGTANEISASAATGAITLSLPAALDLGGKTVEIPNSATLPGTCNTGEMYMDTDATSGQRFYLCQSANTWALQGDGGAGGGITSLEGQTGATQTFTDDTNVTIVSAANAHVITWAGTLAVARGGIGVGTITGLMQGNGTSAVTGITNSTTVGQTLRVTGSNNYGFGALDLADTDAVTGVLPNGNTTAASANTLSAIVTRDGSGNFAAGTITAALTGNSSTTTALAANGANCSGSLPRGVDASGAAEGCADADLTTEVTGLLPWANIATRTNIEKMLDGTAMPDTSGNVFMEPYSIKATNDFYIPNVWIFNDTSTDLILYGSFTIPNEFVSGAKACMVWTSTATSGNTRWKFGYYSVGGDDTTSLDQSADEETALEVNDVAPTAANRRLRVCHTLTDANIAAGDTMMFRIIREGSDTGNDTMAAAAMLVRAEFEYQGK